MVKTNIDAQLAEGNLEGAVNQLISDVDEAKAIAQQGLSNLARHRNRIEEISAATLEKYPLL